MEVVIEKRKSVTLVGIEAKTYGMMKKGVPNSIPSLWEEFNQLLHQIPNQNGGFYGLIEFPKGWQLGNRFYYTAAVAVSEIGDLPESLAVKKIPEKTYAIVRFNGHFSEIGKGFNYFYSEWLDQSNYIKDGPFEYEYYGEDILIDRTDALLEVHFPIKEK